MPYTFKKQGDQYVVYKKDTGKRVGATAGNKEALRKYLAALHINANESLLRDYIIKEIKKVLNESIEGELKDMLDKLEPEILKAKGLQQEGILTATAFILSIPGLIPVIINAVKAILKKSGINLKKKNSQAWYSVLEKAATTMDQTLDLPFNKLLSVIVTDEKKREKYASYLKAFVLTTIAVVGAIDWSTFQKSAAFAKTTGWIGAKEAFERFFTNPKVVNSVAVKVNAGLAAAKLV